MQFYNRGGSCTVADIRALRAGRMQTTVLEDDDGGGGLVGARGSDQQG